MSRFPPPQKRCSLIRFVGPSIRPALLVFRHFPKPAGQTLAPVDLDGDAADETGGGGKQIDDGGGDLLQRPQPLERDEGPLVLEDVEGIIGGGGGRIDGSRRDVVYL